ncbi:hypothetical protein PsorP6_014991 [Peronosclerospora sorghi]|uniref:Uncharacterized protein n=1 Tax=Peronosclerospora sorghi TaxID=230839 RepID=A0ACC0VSI9_9STRA|nr:hypothetical protein PsorP6_014991 [Peronosclerospora sorghi]
MTSDKYKDPCAAPPSCLATFGFDGNVVTMFTKKKLRLHIAGTNFRNSPRRSSATYDFDPGDGEIRTGPVNMYRMEQLHQNDNDFEEMDIFPGPLTEDVTGETILEFLDHRLKRSEATANAEEADEDERLLLGVLTNPLFVLAR